MDRQTRNIPLITLLLAALTIVAVVSPEHHRSTLNGAILYVAVAVAGITALALAVLLAASVPIRVLAGDFGGWLAKQRARRTHKRWRTYHYRAVGKDDVVLTIPNDDAVKAPGTPCIVLVADAPSRVRRRSGALTPGEDATDRIREALRGLADFDVTCRVARRSERRSVEVHHSGLAALARFPDEWFGRPGRYRVRWAIVGPDGQTERASDTVRLHRSGAVAATPLLRFYASARKLIRHLRGQDKQPST